MPRGCSSTCRRGGARNGTGLLGYSASPTFVNNDGYTPAFYWDNGVPAYQKAPFFSPTLNTGNTTTTPQAGGVTYGDPTLGGRPPIYQNWNFGLQRALNSTLTASVNYVGSNGHFLGGGGRGFWSGQMDPKYLALGNLLRAAATPANVAAAQKIFPAIKLPYSNYNGTIGQMLRPFPQYSGVSDVWGDVGNSNYNSLQASLAKRLSRGLVFNFYYTFSKGFDDTAGSRSAYNWGTEKAQSILPSHVITAFFVYRLPFGQGQIGAGNAVVERLASNWQLSGITTYGSGSGFGSIGANCNTPNAGSCYADYNPNFSGPVRINGSYGSGDLLGPHPPAFLDKNAFLSPAPFTYGSTPRTLVDGLRNPSSSNQSVSLRREFHVRESWRLEFQADAFNCSTGSGSRARRSTSRPPTSEKSAGKATRPAWRSSARGSYSERLSREA
ncbi:MAG TPA: hypothetical protein VEU11_01645, partial [Terriglobales bacterium]|nr:hypothetical protein [Terriglobales bacterium]